MMIRAPALMSCGRGLFKGFGMQIWGDDDNDEFGVLDYVLTFSALIVVLLFLVRTVMG